MMIPCPKCGASNVDLYKDRSKWSIGNWPQDAVLHCRYCAYRLYGIAAVTYTNGLAAKVKEQEAERLKKQAEEQLLVQEATIAEEARKERRRARDREYQRKKRQHLKLVQSTPRCVWNGCANTPRVNSKYCSRNCSNKNARFRAKERQHLRVVGP
jgi:hypothetical protein